MNKKITNSQKRIVEILDYFGISLPRFCKMRIFKVCRGLCILLVV